MTTWVIVCLAASPVVADPQALRILAAQLDTLRQESQFVEACATAQKMVDLAEIQHGPDHPETADAVYALEWAYLKAGETAKAKNLQPRTVRLMEATRGRELAQSADRLNQLAWAYYPTDHSAAEMAFQRALEVNERIEGTNGPTVGENLFNLGVFYSDLHDYSKAKACLERALAVNQASNGMEDVRNGSIYHFLGLAYQCLWDLKKAEDCYEKALQVLKGRDKHEEMVAAHCLNSYGQLCRYLRRFGEAEQLHLRALEIMERVRGADHFEVAYVLASLGTLFETTGDFTKAEPMFARAYEIDRRYWGANHEKTLSVLRNWACLEISAGKTNEALALLLRAQPGTELALEHVLSFAPAAERLAFKEYGNLMGPLGTLGNAAGIAELILHCKGVVTDSLLQDRQVALRSPNPQVRGLVAEFSRARERVECLDLMGRREVQGGQSGSCTSEKRRLEARMEQIESDLARQASGLKRTPPWFSVGPKQIQALLPLNSALLEQVRYSRYLGKGIWEPWYGVVVLLPKTDPQWVALGPADRIEKTLRMYQHGVRQHGDSSALGPILHTLYEQLWAPLAPLLSHESRQIIVSPDGDLNFVSFATLLTPEDRFLGENFLFSYVSSARDLLQDIQSLPRRSLYVWANPDFGMDLPGEAPRSQEMVASRSGMMRELRDFRFGPLPGSERESRLLVKRAKELGFSNVYLHLGKDATESELRRIQSPDVLHLATHGFSVAAEMGESDANAAAFPLQTGLALAGALRTLKAWDRGEAPPAQCDGILTSEEVTTLNLHGTRLVVVSTCESGVGQAISGEGVSGLRRAFLEAGAQNLLLTLWPIDDDKTASLVVDFYDQFSRRGDAALALAETQRHWLAKLREQNGAGEACRIAGPFILSFQGRPGCASN